MPPCIDTGALSATSVSNWRYRLKVICRSRSSNHVRFMNVTSHHQLTMVARNKLPGATCALLSQICLDTSSKASLDLNVAALNVIGHLVNVKRHPLNVHCDARRRRLGALVLQLLQVPSLQNFSIGRASNLFSYVNLHYAKHIILTQSVIIKDFALQNLLNRHL